MSTLNPLDSGFLLVQSKNTPMNVAGLLTFQVPEGYTSHFAQDLYQTLTKDNHAVAPFNRRLQIRLTGLPRWIEDKAFDIRHHVRLHGLPRPGTQAQLETLVTELHTQPFNPKRPLWEFHIIDGLENGQIAVLNRFSHIMVDGGRVLRIYNSFLSADADAPLRPFWQQSLTKPPKPVEKSGLVKGLVSKASRSAKQTGNAARQVADMARITKLPKDMLLNAVKGTEQLIPVPFTAAKTPFNNKPTAARRSAFGNLAVNDLKRIGRLTDSTINDVVMTISDMALQRYLSEQGITLDQPLEILMPMDTRQPGQLSKGNSFLPAPVKLGAPDLSPAERLSKISATSTKLKAEIQQLNPDAFQLYMTGIGTLNYLAPKYNLEKLVPKAANLSISNMRAFAKPMYLNGARLSNIYPLSVLFPGQSLTMTLVGYHETLCVTFDYCPDTLVGGEHLFDYLCDALAELEQDVLNQAKQAVSAELAQLPSRLPHSPADHAA